MSGRVVVEPKSKWTLGILNVSCEETVPGTVQMLKARSQNTAENKPSNQNSSEADDTQTMKDQGKKFSKDGAIILEPQPDDSPNDPLNWPSWRRNLILASVGFFAMLGGGVTPLIAAGFTNVANEFDVHVERVALTIGFTMMGLGVGAVIVSPAAIMFGKRPVYIITAALSIITSLWAGWSPSFECLLAARVFQGMSLSSVECLPSATITEIFFLHERAYRLGLYTLMLLGGRNLIPLVSAAIIQSLGWRWAFWMIALCLGLALGLIIFFVPESFWKRDEVKAPSGVSKITSQDQKPPANTESGPFENNSGKTSNASDVEADPEKRPQPSSSGEATTYTQRLRELPPQGFFQLMKFSNGRLRQDNFFRIMLRPFNLLMYPAIIWSAIVYGCSIGWLIVISETTAIIYRDQDRYGFSALQTGLVYISPFIGGAIGSVAAGMLSDFAVKYMARRNNGVYEPEFRLVMILPVMIATCAGLIGYGWSAQVNDHWIVPTIFFGTISFGCSLGSTTAINFAMDSYRRFAAESLVTLNFTKNIVHGLAFSLFVTNWMGADGPRDVFIWLGIIQLVVMLSTIPMYIFGKRARKWSMPSQ